MNHDERAEARRLGTTDQYTESRETSLGSKGSNNQGLFGEEFKDIVDYIHKITYRIWEEKGIGRIYDYYSSDCPVHTSSGTICGADKIVEGTIQALAAVPDRRLYADDVIWSGDESNGFYTSHRITHAGHNTGFSRYGAPTNRQIRYGAIANCAIRDNRIVEEWLVRDEVALIRQLGLDPHALAARAAQAEAEQGNRCEIDGGVESVKDQETPEPNHLKYSGDFDIEDFVVSNLHGVWNRRLLNTIDDHYGERFVCDSVSGRHLHGVEDFKSFVLSLMASFPDLTLAVDHFCALEDEIKGYRTATRWTIHGTHRGYGMYGEPTGERIRILGTSHHKVEDGKFVREWTLFDEFDLLKQLCTPELVGRE